MLVNLQFEKQKTKLPTKSPVCHTTRNLISATWLNCRGTRYFFPCRPTHPMGKLQNLEVCISECTGLSMLLHKLSDNKSAQPNPQASMMQGGFSILDMPSCQSTS